ncbi:MAG: VanZ family protein [Olsenella sp.]|nr:VanZ family protein [Olsenella sp.]
MERRQGGPAWAWVLLALWVCVIWGHSLVPGAGSDAESLSVVGVTRMLFETFGVTDEHVMNVIVRKTGHFCEFAILGLLTLNALRPRLARPFGRLVPLSAIWVLVPLVDETIQLFVPGRAGMVADVLLDMCGFACAVLVARIACQGPEA